MKDDIKFDMDAAIKALREGKDLSDQDGILAFPVSSWNSQQTSKNWRSPKTNYPVEHL